MLAEPHPASPLPLLLLLFQFTLGVGEEQIQTDAYLVLQIPPSRVPVDPEQKGQPLGR